MSGKQAVFLDRDGVLTEPVWNPITEAYESPHTEVDVRLCDDVVKPLRRLQVRGLTLFIVSNQPSFSKGKVSLEVLHDIGRRVEAIFAQAGVRFAANYYCYHHPNGIVPGFSGSCACRKPEPHFLHEASDRFGINLNASWMIGDRDSDVECGARAGCQTVLVLHPHSREYQGRSHPNHVVNRLAEAVRIIDAAVATSSLTGPRSVVPPGGTGTCS